MSDHQMIRTGQTEQGLGMGVVISVLLWVLFAAVRAYM
jgi:hypothetical protein